MIDGTGYATMTAAGLTDGTEALDSLSVNTKLGFSIAKWSGTTALTTDTVAHGLGQPPELIIHKSTSLARDWNVYSKGVGLSKNLHLNLTDEARTNEYWTVNANTHSIHDTSTSGDWIAYSFVSKRGVSKVGSYTGTGAAGNKVYTGFQPAFVMMKKSSASGGSWLIVDNKRKESDGDLSELFADTTTAESGSGYNIDFNADGFTLNTTTDNANTSGATYIYLAFAAEKPDSLTPSKADFEEGTVASGAKLELKANDYSGSGNWLDSTSNDNDVTFTGTPTYVNDGDSDYFEFDGSSDYGTIPHSTDLDISTSFTVEAWLNRDDNGEGYIMTKSGGASGLYGWYFQFHNDTAQGYSFAVYNTSDSRYTASATIAKSGTAGQWQHVVGTCDGSNVKIYVDGDLKATTAISGTLAANTAELVLGGYYNYGGKWDGKIAQARIYQTALSSSEVKANYDATKGFYTYPDLKLNLAASAYANPTIGTVTSGAELEFDANDYSGSGNWLNTGAASSSDGTITGATYNDDEKSDYFSFSGSDYITSSSSGLTANRYTIEAWFYIDTLKTAGIVSWGDQGANYERRSMITWNGGSGSYYLYSSSYSSNIKGATALAAGKWYHGAVTMDSGSAKIYLNGELDGSGTNTLSAYTSSDLYIGRTAESSEIFDGNIAIARVYDTVLTADQIKANYDAHKEQYSFRFADLTNNGNHPTLYSDPTFDKELGDWVTFDGSADYGEISDVGVDTDTVSLELWARPHNITDQYQYIAMLGSAAATAGKVASVSMNYGKLYSYDGNNFPLTGTVLTANKWHHIVVTRSGTSRKIYVNGENVQTDTTATAYSGDDSLDIARYGYSGGSSYFDGDIGQFRIYSSELTADQVMQNYRFTKNDYPNGNNGTLPTTYLPSFSVDSFDFVRGGITSGDQVQFGSSFHTALTNTVEGTVTAWINADVINGRHTIFGTGHTSDNNDWAVFRTTNSRTLQFSINNAGTANGFYTTATANITTGSWIHVAMSVSEAGVGKMYINGASQAVTYQTGGATQWFNDVSTDVASIGSFDRGSSGQYYDPFDGKISEVKVYDRVLTDDEISALHTAGR